MVFERWVPSYLESLSRMIEETYFLFGEYNKKGTCNLVQIGNKTFTKILLHHYMQYLSLFPSFPYYSFVLVLILTSFSKLV